jgi:hypothetical protein
LTKKKQLFYLPKSGKIPEDIPLQPITIVLFKKGDLSGKRFFFEYVYRNTCKFRKRLHKAFKEVLAILLNISAFSKK